MTKKEIVNIEDWDEFKSILNKSKCTEAEKSSIVLARWEHLIDKYSTEAMKENDTATMKRALYISIDEKTKVNREEASGGIS